MTTALHITGGRIYDPANGVDGIVGDIRACNGRIVDSLPEGTPVRKIDATGMVIMPGGVDIHCHIASASVNRARAMQGEEHAAHVHPADPNHNLRSGSGRLVPSSFLTGYRYAALGYTTAIDAAVAPSASRHTHLQLHDTPNLDAGFLLLLANHQAIIELLAGGEDEQAIRFIAHMLHATGALGIKVVNPGGVAAWRSDPAEQIVPGIDHPIATGGDRRVTPRRILELIATAAERLGLPHPPHIHCNRLGLPGNVQTTLETMRALDGRRAHFTHLQFHAYGQTKKGDFTSAAADLAAHLDAHPEFSADVGQVVFGPAFTLTADTPLEYTLWQLMGNRYASIEIEQETGCGLMPIRYRDTQLLHSLQWATGLELMLACRDPWRMLLSTDHPNGGSFVSYPAVIAALMSRDVRKEQIARCPARAMKRTRLPEIDRQMTLSEIAIITRAGPARVLGLSHKGHLGAGADADITIYPDMPQDPQRMFESPRYVIKGGCVLVEDGELRQAVPGGPGRTLRADVAADPDGRDHIARWLRDRGSIDISQLGLHDFERQAMVTAGAAGAQR